jgi:hypothetical protein
MMKFTVGKAKIRRSKTRNTQVGHGASIWGFERMSRTEAVMKIKKLLRRSPTHSSAQQLISLFNIHPEELTEAGVPFEVLKAFEKRYQF